MALGLAVGISGLAFGAAAVSSGLSPVQACAMSLLTFTGASQFALAGAVASGGLAAGVAGAVLLGSRNTLYGLRLAGLLRVRGPARLLAAHGVIDETTAIALAQPTPAAARTGFRATFATLYVTWNLATLVGAVGAGRLGSPQSFGLDVVGPAAFLALIWPRLRAGRTERAAGCYGLKLAGLTVPRRVLDIARVRRFAELVPVALLAALTAVLAAGDGQALTVDPARLAGLGAAVIALLLRAPFLLVIIAAAATAAALRALGIA